MKENIKKSQINKINKKQKIKIMSFFGLTAFGPENFVKTTLVNFGCKNNS